MTGYLQRLIDSALPASDPPALAPVLKSTSPIFEQNQLLGLPGLQAAEADREVVPPVSDAPMPSHLKAPVPPVAGTALPTFESTWHEALPATPAPSSYTDIGRSIAGDRLVPRGRAADLIAPPPHGPLDSVPEPARPDPEILDSAPRLETVPVAQPERATALPATAVPRETVFAPVEIERVATDVTPRIGARRASPPNIEPGPAALQIVNPDVPRAPELIERALDAPPRLSVLEPRPRPDFGDTAPEADQPQPETLQAQPRIAIGRITVEVVPDQAPAAKPAIAPRTAATASMIGPLGNRRARRRLFALARL